MVSLLKHVVRLRLRGEGRKSLGIESFDNIESFDKRGFKSISMLLLSC